MNDVAFWKLGALSDRQLLDGLGAVLGSGRRLLAELVAHLGEVEERRLHLDAACSSMFSYCVNRLGMSEDEACRRIEVARLARRYPAMFPLLAAGRLSLSVAALLKPHLSAENQLDVLAAVSGNSVQQAREVIAARFPRPDAPSSVRKLPERRAALPPFETRAAPCPLPCRRATPALRAHLETRAAPGQHQLRKHGIEEATQRLQRRSRRWTVHRSRRGRELPASSRWLHSGIRSNSPPTPS
jgi:hypothetical protein